MFPDIVASVPNTAQYFSLTPNLSPQTKLLFVHSKSNHTDNISHTQYSIVSATAYLLLLYLLSLSLCLGFLILILYEIDLDQVFIILDFILRCLCTIKEHSSVTHYEKFKLGFCYETGILLLFATTFGIWFLYLLGGKQLVVNGFFM